MWYFWLSSSRAIVLLPLTSHKKPSCRWRNGSGYQLRCSPVSVSAAWCVRGIFDAANHSPSLPLFPLSLLFYTGHLALSHTADQLKVVANPIQSTLQLKTGSLVVVGVHIDKSSTLAQYLISYCLYVMKPTWLMYHTLWLASSCHNLPQFSLPYSKDFKEVLDFEIQPS